MRVISFFVVILLCAIAVFYLFFYLENRVILKENSAQARFEIILLDELDKGNYDVVKKLLSADIQRAIIALKDSDMSSKDIPEFCKYINQRSIRLIVKYDQNASMDYLEKIERECTSLMGNKQKRSY